MLTSRLPLHEATRLAATLIAAAALSTTVLPSAARADGTTQPDPPVPVEALPGAPAAVPLGGGDFDCRCGVLYARDLAGRVDGHVEQWESLQRAAVTARRGTDRAGAMHVAFVDGVVGFPLHDFRLSD